ncbi:uncharacterized protein BO97DRAFT_440402 [Aspergillus homomorphus CBS 101889]|uniref:Uncharacterized protein n=1 Tax=Aspergillus homomorphus (strain CBS 101889) TaxID=1450537 RepID=A0A395I9K4_ASPHC|nr:hypothetical protein BO97DRAFT_440402 [Aspergillus homomorphus CBS 101889]RAL15748.1 hypothetical protein BO97DRAFT_440402 [Aspergillus homomorphus CBS 101889]
MSPSTSSEEPSSEAPVPRTGHRGERMRLWPPITDLEDEDATQSENNGLARRRSASESNGDGMEIDSEPTESTKSTDMPQRGAGLTSTDSNSEGRIPVNNARVLRRARAPLRNSRTYTRLGRPETHPTARPVSLRTYKPYDSSDSDSDPPPVRSFFSAYARDDNPRPLARRAVYPSIQTMHPNLFAVEPLTEDPDRAYWADSSDNESGPATWSEVEWTDDEEEAKKKEVEVTKKRKLEEEDEEEEEEEEEGEAGQESV